MKINEDFYIYCKRGTKEIVTNLRGSNEFISDTTADYSSMNRILRICRGRKYSIESKNVALRNLYKLLGFNDDQIERRLFMTKSSKRFCDETNSSSSDSIKTNKNLALSVVDRLIKFFSEFNFSPSFRFVNSVCISKNPAEYIRNYFMVQDHAACNEINEKIKSTEFRSIAESLKDFKPTPINNRFELYFGDPGTGKTTKAMKLADKCIVCSSDMLPSDLMQNFVFKDGKADFDKSDLWIAMEEGKSIVLDEVNMLPFESLRFLQGITDSKDTINYKGYTINVHPNFKIYATMNLFVNGQCIPLPAPLVDRSYDIREFKLTAKELVSALM